MKNGDRVAVVHPNSTKKKNIDFSGTIIDEDETHFYIKDFNGLRRKCNKKLFKVTKLS